MGSTIIPLTPALPPASTPTPGTHTPRVTYWDMIQFLQDYVGADENATAPHVVRRAILSALRELTNARHWSYYYSHGRINTNGMFTTATGTVQYRFSSGAYPCQLTISGDVWPSWAANGTIRFSTVIYDVAQRISDTILTLNPALAPLTDLPIIATNPTLPTPGNAPTLAGAGMGTITGTYQAYVQFIDGNGDTSALSPLSAPITVNGVGQIIYTNVPTPPSGSAVVARAILRNVNGESTVYYQDFYTDDLVSTSFTGTNVDSILVTLPGTNLWTTFDSFYQDTYTLWPDFVATDAFFADIAWGEMEYVHPSKWLQVNRYYASYSNTPRFWTIMADPKIPNRLCLRIFPFPDSDRSLDSVYHRAPRPVTLDNYSAGSASVNAASGATSTITGTGTRWTSAMVGSVIRLSGDVLNDPTGIDGDNPAAVEGNILQVVSATQLTVDASITQSFTNVQYIISDPIDIETGPMMEAYYRCCEMHVAYMRRFKDRDQCRQEYELALEIAKEADSRVFQTRVAGLGGPYRQRLANMPRGPDVN